VGKLAEWVTGLLGRPRGREQQGLGRQQADLPQRREEQEQQGGSSGGGGSGGSGGAPVELQQVEQDRADVLPAAMAASSMNAFPGRMRVGAPRQPPELSSSLSDAPAHPTSRDRPSALQRAVL
jgi:hypothetical protein